MTAQQRCMCSGRRASTVGMTKSLFFLLLLLVFFFLEGGMKWVIYHGLLFNLNFNGKINKQTLTCYCVSILLIFFFKGDWFVGSNFICISIWVTGVKGSNFFA